MDEALIKGQAEKVKLFMKEADPEKRWKYHDWRHVSQVVQAMQVLAPTSGVEGSQLDDLLLAAIWHDAAIAQGKEGHEERSAQLAARSLQEEGLDEERIDRIVQLIHSTDMNHSPEGLEEQLMRDSDLAHLAGPEYLEFYGRLYTELKATTEPQLSPNQWKDRCVTFMKSQEYHSPSAKQTLSEGKEKNLQQLMETDAEALLQQKGKKLKKKAKKKPAKDKTNYRPDKGIETMFRVTLRNHLNLSRIADDKANTLISVNAIILSIVLSALFPKLDSNPFLIYPGFSLLLVSIITIILATYSTIPRTTHGVLSRDDVAQRRGNLLFFGNFHSMSLGDYEWGIQQLMSDGDYLYRSLTRDLYFLGIVLERKYRLLRYAYIIFVSGLIISIFLFVWSIMTLEAPIEHTITAP